MNFHFLKFIFLGTVLCFIFSCTTAIISEMKNQKENPYSSCDAEIVGLVRSWEEKQSDNLVISEDAEFEQGIEFLKKEKYVKSRHVKAIKKLLSEKSQPEDYLAFYNTGAIRCHPTKYLHIYRHLLSYLKESDKLNSSDFQDLYSLLRKWVEQTSSYPSVVLITGVQIDVALRMSELRPDLFKRAQANLEILKREVRIQGARLNRSFEKALPEEDLKGQSEVKIFKEDPEKFDKFKEALADEFKVTDQLGARLIKTLDSVSLPDS